MKNFTDHRNHEVRVLTGVMAVICATACATSVVPGLEDLINRALILGAALVVLAVFVRLGARWVRERRSVHLTNVALLAMFSVLALTLGWQRVLLVHMPVMVVASIVGVWLFSLQHRFETAHWSRRGQWNADDASMDGSSWFDLPRILHWLTGNIGFHHVHHLNPRVPNYRLSAAHAAIQPLWPVDRLSFLGGLRAPWLTLWDEERHRLVSFGALRGNA